MQVMNGAEFKQAQVVIGQQTKTKGFSVSDDPMLMSILSTGLYQNPLKSMIQEAVFNAWDAHKASNRTDQPIEIIFTDDNQLIISDSGYGIPPEDMYDIYCVYGASTKRDEEGQTGGFGLGCKAPFAYTDSFRVTSANGGKRHLYLVSRANDDNDGKPGITELVGDIECEDSGLMVSIPLKDDRDVVKAYEILKNKIFPYSGINWTLQFKEHDLEAEQEEELAPGKFIIGPGRMDSNKGLTAQYGGVAYKVPYDDECGYAEEYNFLANTIGSVGSVRAGFASGTLTPLPSREGLNLSEQTVINLRDQIQIIIDELNVLIHPMMELAINWVAHCLGDTEEELYDSLGRDSYHFSTPFGKFAKAGIGSDFEDVLTRDQINQFIDQPIESEEDHELIKRLREVIMRHTRKMIKGVGVDWFLRRRAIAWSIQNDHNRERFDILKRASESTSHGSLSERMNQRTIESVIAALLRVSRHVAIKPHLRTRIRGENQSSRFTPVAEETQPYAYQKSQTYDKLVKEGKHKPTTRIKLHTLRAVQGSRSAPKSLNSNVIVLAHTIKDGNHCDEAENGYSSHQRKTPIFVIGTSVAKLNKAKEFLESEGFEVLVAPKYVESQMELEQAAMPAPVFEGWPRLDPHAEGFACEYETHKEPTMYILYSKTRFKEDNDYYYRRDDSRLDHGAVYAIKRFFSDDRIVVINHPNKVRAVKKLGIQSLSERVDEMVRKMFADPAFVNKLSMHLYAEENGNVPDGLLQIPEFSKLLGLPYVRTRELLKFRQAKELLDNLSSCTSDVLCSGETQTLIKKNMAVDPAVVSRTSSLLTALNVLDARVLKDRINGMGEGERKTYAEKLARFIKTTAT